MLKRKIIIIAIALLAVGLMYLVIMKLVGSDGEGTIDPDAARVPTHLPGLKEVATPKRGPAMKIPESDEGAEIEKAENVEIRRKDEQGRLILRFVAKQVKAISSTEAEIIRPEIYQYTTSGEAIRILADHGVIDTGGKGLRLNEINKGRLSGNVHITHDRGTPDNADDDVNITMDFVDFSDKAGLLSTDGPVKVVSPEMRVTAKKMRMSLEPETRELKSLSLLEDVRIELLGAGEKGPLGFYGAPSPEGTKPAVAAALGDGAPSPEETLYRIEMLGNVRAVQGEFKLAGDRLELYNRQRRQLSLDGSSRGTEPEGPRETAPAPKPEPAPKAPAGEPLVVTCSGPVNITPVAAGAKPPRPGAYDEVLAEGGNVVVEQGEGKLIAQKVLFNAKKQTGTATDSRGVKLVMGDQFRLTGPRVDFNRQSGLMLVKGAGNLMTRARSTPGARAPEGEPPPMTAKWAEGMRVAFTQLPTGAGREALQQAQIKMARFSGKAELRQGDDFIKADKVAMEFGPDVSKPGRAKATRRLVRLEAAGNVRIKQADVEAEADFVKRDAALGLFVLKGKPASAKQGDTRITGQEIVYNEISAQADVLGAGTLTMPVRTNLEGRALKKSEALKIKWAKGMVYRDRKNFAHFSEKVHAQVGQDSLSGDQLWVYFQGAPDAAKAGSAKDVASLVGRKRISKILSTGNVAARTIQTDPKTGRKNREVAIACQSLAFVEAGQKAQIDGPGSLIILQQDPGQAGDANPWADVPANERPPKGFSRTKVTWKKSAAMSQMQQVGFFEDTVVAEHMGRGLAGPGAGQTPQRKSVIKSDRLWVTFKTAAGAAEGFQFSRLDAVGNVFFTSGTSKASGQSISYDDKQGSITITGGSGKFAQFVDEDEKKQQFTETVAKKIMFWPATQRAKFEGVDRITVTPR